MRQKNGSDWVIILVILAWVAFRPKKIKSYARLAPLDDVNGIRRFANLALGASALALHENFKH